MNHTSPMWPAAARRNQGSRPVVLLDEGTTRFSLLVQYHTNLKLRCDGSAFVWMNWMRNEATNPQFLGLAHSLHLGLICRGATFLLCRWLAIPAIFIDREMALQLRCCGALVHRAMLCRFHRCS
jgi:hypothetical protein